MLVNIKINILVLINYIYNTERQRIIMVQENKNIYNNRFKTQDYTNNSNIYPVLFQDIAKEWFEFTCPHIKESSKTKYYNICNKYIYPKLGQVYINQVTDNLLEKFCNELLISGGVNCTKLSPKTTSDILSVVRNILRFGINKGYRINCDGSSVTIR